MPRTNHRAKVFKLMAESNLSVGAFLPIIKKQYEKAKGSGDFDAAIPIYQLLHVMDLAIGEEEAEELESSDDTD